MCGDIHCGISSFLWYLHLTEEPTGGSLDEADRLLCCPTLPSVYVSIFGATTYVEGHTMARGIKAQVLGPHSPLQIFI